MFFLPSCLLSHSPFPLSKTCFTLSDNDVHVTRSLRAEGGLDFAKDDSALDGESDDGVVILFPIACTAGSCLP